MKRFFLSLFAFFLVISITSCGSEDLQSFIGSGATCLEEGKETCSDDKASVLICNLGVWKEKESCNPNFGKYCLLNEGKFVCAVPSTGGDSGDSAADSGDSGSTGGDSGSGADSGSTGGDSGSGADSGDSGDSGSTGGDSGDSGGDSGSTGGDSDSGDSGDSAADSGDSAGDSGADSGNSAADSGNSAADSGDSGYVSPIPSAGDCANIMVCMENCPEPENNQSCIDSCYSNGTDEGKNQYNALFACNNENSCDGAYSCWWEKCRDAAALCGFGGDSEHYQIPYGSATISGTFTHLFGADETQIPYDKTISSFATGTFGIEGSIIDPTSTAGSFAYALLKPSEDGNPPIIVLWQDYKDAITKNPLAIMLIDGDATTPGTYTVGLTSDDKVQFFVRENDGENLTCVHAIGFGEVNIAQIGQTPGETPIELTGEITLYSPKAAVVYGGDITNENLIACDPK